MNYSELIEAMHKFRTGRITRAEMIAAFALWQEPVTIAEEMETTREKMQKKYGCQIRYPNDPGNFITAAVEAAIR